MGRNRKRNERFIAGVDPVVENPPVNIMRIHPDGTLENMMYKTPSFEEIREELTKLSGVPKKYLGEDWYLYAWKKYMSDLVTFPKMINKSQASKE